MELFDESTEVRVHLATMLWVGGVRHLIAVVVHLHPAAWANHLFEAGHVSILVPAD